MRKLRTLSKWVAVFFTVAIVLSFIGIEPLKSYRTQAADFLWDQGGQLVDFVSDSVDDLQQSVSSLPFDLKTGIFTVDDSIVYIDLVATANSETEIGREYSVHVAGDSGDDWVFVFFRNHEKVRVMLILPVEVSASLLDDQKRQYDEELSDAQRDLDSAVERLDEHDLDDAEILYDFWWGRDQLPSYSEMLERPQVRKGLSQSVEKARRYLSEERIKVNDKWSGITADDLLPFLTISVVGD